VCELADREGSRLKDAPKIIQGLREGCSVQSRGVDGFRARKLTLDCFLVCAFPLPSVIAKQGYSVGARQMPQNVVRTNFAAGIDRQEFARFDPEDSQGVLGVDFGFRRDGNFVHHAPRLSRDTTRTVNNT
jgi:hypothetical protein